MTQSPKQPTSGVDEKAAQAAYDKLPYGIVCIRQVIESYEAAKAKEQPDELAKADIAVMNVIIPSPYGGKTIGELFGSNIIRKIVIAAQLPKRESSECKACDGAGWVIGTHDGVTPEQEQCGHCYGTGRAPEHEPAPLTEDERREAVEVMAEAVAKTYGTARNYVADEMRTALTALLERFELVRRKP